MDATITRHDSVGSSDTPLVVNARRWGIEVDDERFLTRDEPNDDLLQRILQVMCRSGAEGGIKYSPERPRSLSSGQCLPPRDGGIITTGVDDEPDDDPRGDWWLAITGRPGNRNGYEVIIGLGTDLSAGVELLLPVGHFRMLAQLANRKLITEHGFTFAKHFDYLSTESRALQQQICRLRNRLAENVDDLTEFIATSGRSYLLTLDRDRIFVDPHLTEIDQEVLDAETVESLLKNARVWPCERRFVESVAYDTTAQDDDSTVVDDDDNSEAERRRLFGAVPSYKGEFDDSGNNFSA